MAEKMKFRTIIEQLVSLYCYLSAFLLLFLVFEDLLRKYFNLSIMKDVPEIVFQAISYLPAVFGLTPIILIAELAGLLQSILITAVVTVLFAIVYLFIGIKIIKSWAKFVLTILLVFSLLFGAVFTILNLRDYGWSFLLLLNALTILVPGIILYLLRSKAGLKIKKSR